MLLPLPTLSQQAVTQLARALFKADAAERVVVAALPRSRAAMHLDTVFTFCDLDLCTTFREVADQIRDLLTKGRTGGHLFFTTKDARQAYDQLRQKGVEFSQELTEQPYGIDFGLRDPFGNHIRVAQLKEVAAAKPSR